MSSISTSLRHGTSSSYINSPTSGRPIRSVPQPPLRFLPHYSSPKRRGPESSTSPRRRERSSHNFMHNTRPVSMIGSVKEDDYSTSRRNHHLDGQRPSGYPLSFSSMASNAPPTTLQRTGSDSLDPNDLVLPPPKEFCC